MSLTAKVKKYWPIVVGTASLTYLAFFGFCKLRDRKIAADAKEAGISFEEQKRYLEQGALNHYTEGLIENRITAGILEQMVEKEGLERGDIWVLQDSFKKFRGNEYCESFDGPKWVEWSANGFDIPAMWTCWDAHEALEDAAACKQRMSNEDIIRFIENGGSLKDAAQALNSGKTADEILEQYTRPSIAVSQEEKWKYEVYIECDYLDMRILKSNGIDTRKIMLNGKPVIISDWFGEGPASIIGDIRNGTNYWDYRLSQRLEWTIEAAKEGKLNDKIYIKWREAGHSSHDSITGIRFGYSLEAANKWKEAGYTVAAVHDFREFIQSKAFVQLKGIVEDLPELEKAEGLERYGFADVYQFKKMYEDMKRMGMFETAEHL